MSLTLALTGGIASGKSSVAALFQKWSVPVIDADVIARDLVAPGQPALTEIADAFGAQMLTAFGELDRRRMREHVFSDVSSRRRLEAILHPRIREELYKAAQNCPAEYCILAIPLLAESWKHYRWIDRVLVIDLPDDIQMQRLMHRDGMTRALAKRMLDSQSSRRQRLALAHDVIDNAGMQTALTAVVDRLDRWYRRLADAC